MDSNTLLIYKIRQKIDLESKLESLESEIDELYSKLTKTEQEQFMYQAAEFL